MSVFFSAFMGNEIGQGTWQKFREPRSGSRRICHCLTQVHFPRTQNNKTLIPYINNIFKQTKLSLKAPENNRIYHHTVEGTRESHPSVHDLQSSTRLAESWMLQIMDTRMGFPCPFHNVMIDYFSPTPISTSF